MKRKFTFSIAILIIYTVLQSPLSFGQLPGCVYKDPIIQIDFGSNSAKEDINLSLLKRYNQMNGGCPDDGNYSFASYTDNCFGGHWHSLPADHTSGDAEGRMLLVNASYEPGLFFMVNVGGLKAGATYEFAAWIVNICRSGYECTTIPPLLKVTILAHGRPVKSFVTGEIHPLPEPLWKRYSAAFTLPAETAGITIQIENENPGGCGNDFALDDITLRECILPEPIIARSPAREAPKPLPKQSAPPAKKPQPELPAKKTDEQLPLKTTPPVVRTERKELPATLAVPGPIANRANPVVKQVLTEAAELIIELYDNGQVDGDTVSIFHNNQLVQSRAALSEKPVTIKVLVDKAHPHHELVMVAENLGSIPPNTSLMIITTKRKRYEVFISSSEQKNAKIIIDLQE